MNKSYRKLYCSIVFVTIVLLIVYIKICNETIKNILGNISAGMISGLMIAFLSNMKNKYIYEIHKEKDEYNTIIEISNSILISQININKKQEVTALELMNIYVDIKNNILDYFEVKGLNIELATSRLNYNKDSFEKGIDERIEKLSKLIYDEIISKEKYRKMYQSELARYLTDIHNLQIALKRDLKLKSRDLEELYKSII